MTLRNERSVCTAHHQDHLDTQTKFSSVLVSNSGGHGKDRKQGGWALWSIGLPSPLTMDLDLKPLSTNDRQQLLGTSFILRSTQFTEVLGEDTKQRRVK